MTALSAWTPREGDNALFMIELAQVPLGDCSLSARHPFHEHVHRHGKNQIPHADMHSAIPHGVFWHFLDERGQPHIFSPNLLNATEQNVGPCGTNSFKGLNDLAAVLA